MVDSQSDLILALAAKSGSVIGLCSKRTQRVHGTRFCRKRRLRRRFEVLQRTLCLENALPSLARLFPVCNRWG